MKYDSPKQFSEQVIIKETKFWSITLWNNQYYLGRASIQYKDLSKRHLSELNEDEILDLFHLIQKYEKALKKSFNTTNFNWACLMNNQYKEKNVNKPDKLHFHVWPRYQNQVEFKGEVFEDEVFAHHYDKYKEKIVDRDFLVNISDELLKNWD